MSKTFVFGDIHGCFDEFIKLVEQIGITDDDWIVSVGDIVDRGNKSLAVYEYFRKRENGLVLMGNHERKHLNGVLNYAQDIVKLQFGDRYEDFKKWIEQLPYFYETEEAIIVHAFFEHDKLLSEQREDVLAGTTAGSTYLTQKYTDGSEWFAHYTGDKPIIYGHAVVGEHPKIENNTFGIDTGACHAGKLTAMELPSFKIHQIKVKTDHWAEESKQWQLPVLKAKAWENMTMSQIDKAIKSLIYKQDEEVKDFLKHLQTWKDGIAELIITIKTRCQELAETLLAKHGNLFNEQVLKLPYSTALFKAKAGNLTIQNLQKTLNTPQKILDFASDIGLKVTLKKNFK